MQASPTHCSAPQRKLLIVDDDPSIRPLMSAMIQKINPNSEIDWVASAEEALSRIQSRMASRMAYDVVLTDVNLGGGKSGLELAESCFASRIRSSLILMTGLASVKTELPLIQKPFRFDSVRALLAPHLLAPSEALTPHASIGQPAREWPFYLAVALALAFSIQTRWKFQQEIQGGAALLSPTPVEVISQPELQADLRRLLDGGLTSLLKDPNYWKRAEAGSRAQVIAIFGR
jgi:CheY-like chemotaxis protein